MIKVWHPLRARARGSFSPTSSMSRPDAQLNEKSGTANLKKVEDSENQNGYYQFSSISPTNILAGELQTMKLTHFCSIAVCIVTSVAFTTSANGAEPLNVPPKGFTALFNGKDLANWKGLVGNPKTRAEMSAADLKEKQATADEEMRAHWSVKDGLLIYDGKGKSLCTAKDYRNFEMYVDWKILEKGDSGIYVRGTPQIQIWDPNHWKIGSGGLYNNKIHPSQPSKIADNPIGEWNTFQIKMIDEKVWVWLNKELVVDGVVLENFWERDKPIYKTGQIELQHHGNTLYFRNVFLRELDEEGKPKQ